MTTMHLHFSDDPEKMAGLKPIIEEAQRALNVAVEEIVAGMHEHDQEAVRILLSMLTAQGVPSYDMKLEMVRDLVSRALGLVARMRGGQDTFKAWNDAVEKVQARVKEIEAETQRKITHASTPVH
jgi:hypothetical protein